MLRRLTLGFVALACAASVAACSSSDTSTPSSGGVAGIGPNFKTDTIYVANTTQRLIEIYTPSPAPSATPQYTIGGSNTTMSGPRYLTFNSKKQLLVTDDTPNGIAQILTFQTYATGNVLPFGSLPLTSGTHPRGIAVEPTSGDVVVAATVDGGFFPSEVLVIGATGAVSDLIAGTNTGLNIPVGVAVDSNQNIYVSNSAGKSVTVYAAPSPTPTPSTSPSPTPTPTASGSPSPTPSPTPFSNNATPVTTITSSAFTSPQGIALDGAGNLYVADAGSSTAAPKVYVFNAPFAAGTISLTPSRTIVSQNPAFVDPTDVKVDSSGGIYVIDAGSGPTSNGKLLIFPANANGTVTPSTAITLPTGSATGMALSP
jgi:hypothetical protein